MLEWGTTHRVPLAEATVTQPELRGLPEAYPDFPAWQLGLRRLLSVVVAASALVALWPVMVAAALAVKLTSRGPVLFRQERIGSGGRPFTMFKFRTMHHGTEQWIASDPQRWAAYAGNDFKAPANFSRITRVGQLLRRTSIDELPQLFNVLRGEMAIVGVRPVVRAQLEARPGRSQKLYTLLEPGLTGLWQVNGRSTIQRDGRVALDDRYVATWTPWQDVVLLARTPAAVTRVDEAG